MTSPFCVDSPVGPITIAPLDPSRDAAVVHEWLTHPGSWAWGMSDATLDDVRDYLQSVQTDAHQDAWIGRLHDDATFMVETYDPARVTLVGIHEAVDGDLGMHLLVQPPGDRRVSGLTSAVMRAVVAFCFDSLHARRLVVEPDVRNDGIARKNAEVGFRILREVQVGDKRASLAVLAREDAGTPAHGPDARGELLEHLRPESMMRAHRHLVAKAITEFTHERLVEPTAPDPGTDRHVLDFPGGEYSFRATMLGLEHLAVDPASIERRVDGTTTPVDAQQLIVDLQDRLGVPDALVALYLEEIASTVASLSFRLHRASLSSRELARADLQTVEAAMIEGHPSFVANSGRIGFGLQEFSRYAPETGARVRLVWLAARRGATHLALSRDIDESALLSLIGDDLVARFRGTLHRLGLDPDAYLYIPVHPWQWQHRIAITMAPDVGRDDLVYLGESDDEYQAQQSIRTFFNVTSPLRPYVKTALGVQNMGFQRGLSPAYMRVTPAINDWVADLVRQDQTLQAAGFDVLREFASVGYTGDLYHRAAAQSPQTKMLAALWRESACTKVGPGERVMSMAALLHRDADRRSLAAELVRGSGLTASAWLRAYLDAYLLPLVHSLLAHDLAFMPHGENVILVLDEHGVPQRCLMKDIGEEVAVLSDAVALPPSVERIRQVVDARERALAIFTDVFDGVLRHLSAALHVEGVISETQFWREVSDVVERHRDEHPEIASEIDLRAPRFDHSCLNRLQLRNTLRMVDLTDQSSSLIYAGTMPNPIAHHRADA